MSKAQNKFAGMLLVNDDGPIGIIERVTRRSSKQDEMAVVLAGDDHTRYRIPLALIRVMEQADGQTVAHTPIAAHELPNYRGTGGNRAKTEIFTGNTLRIPLAEEELTATTQPIQLGVVHLHKGVEAQIQSIQIPQTTETVQIERIPADRFDPAHYADAALTVIPLSEERLVVHKETVITEYIVIRKEQAVNYQTVSDTVRREVLTISPDPLQDIAPLVHMEGEFEALDS